MRWAANPKRLKTAALGPLCSCWHHVCWLDGWQHRAVACDRGNKPCSPTPAHSRNGAVTGPSMCPSLLLMGRSDTKHPADPARIYPAKGGRIRPYQRWIRRKSKPFSGCFMLLTPWDSLAMLRYIKAIQESWPPFQSCVRSKA